MTTWNEPKDARIDGGEYPNYYIHKSPSGHVIHMDDTKGAESLTIQHRSGSMVQMHPDGSVVFRSHKGRYDVTFGDGKMLITGDFDVTVNGGGSLKVEGDYDMTVQGNMHTVVSGNMETVVNGNQNLAVNGNQDTAIQGNQTTKIAGNAEHTSEGKSYLGGHAGVAVEATGGDAHLRADSGVVLKSGGDTTLDASGNFEANATEIRLNG